MRTLLQKVQSGIATGAAFWVAGAGCASAVRRPDPQDAAGDANMMTSDAANDANVSADAADDAVVVLDSSVADAGHDAGALKPYDLEDLVCGSFDAGSFCCYWATCVVVANAPCPEANDSTLPFQPTDLTCGVTGPFAPNPADPAMPVGNCCYVTGSQAAVGRPLLVANAMLVAPIVTRADWLLRHNELQA